MYVPSNDPSLPHFLDTSYVTSINHTRNYHDVSLSFGTQDDLLIRIDLNALLSDSMPFPPCEKHDRAQFHAHTHDGYPWKVHAVYFSDIEWEEKCSL